MAHKELTEDELDARIKQTDGLLKAGYAKLKRTGSRNADHPDTGVLKSLEIIRSEAMEGRWQEEWDDMLQERENEINEQVDEEPPLKKKEVSKGKR